MNIDSNMVRMNEQARLADYLRYILQLGILTALMFFLTGCASTTVLLVNFNSDNVGAEPASTQATGTVSLDRGDGTIIVVDAPAPGLAANKWARISHPNAPSQQTAIRCNFARFFSEGNYGLLASLYIPSGTEAVTVQFEPAFGGPDDYLNFMHLDFMPEGDVRVNDGPFRFGQFPRDQPFVLSVNLVITATTATAHITLFGGGASGDADVNIDPSLISVARQFGAVRFWMGFQWTGTFFVDDIIVTRKN
jgi:hypothetical protein